MKNTYHNFLQEAKNSVVTDSAKEIISTFINTDIELSNYYEIVKKSFVNELSIFELVKTAALLLALIYFINIAGKCVKSNSILNTFKYLSKNIMFAIFVIPIYSLLNIITKTFNDISVFLGGFVPLGGILLASGGNLNSAKAFGLGFSVLLAASQFLVNYVVPKTVFIFIALAAIDTFSGNGRMILISRALKNNIFSLLAITATVFFIIISFYSKAAAGQDTISAKTIRLLVSNAIPIVGNSVGDALKLVGGSLMTIKNSVGIAGVIFVLTMFLPILLILWIFRLILNFTGALCEMLDIEQVSSVFLHLKFTFDFIIAAFSMIAVVSILNIGILASVSPEILS